MDFEKKKMDFQMKKMKLPTCQPRSAHDNHPSHHDAPGKNVQAVVDDRGSVAHDLGYYLV